MHDDEPTSAPDAAARASVKAPTVTTKTAVALVLLSGVLTGVSHPLVISALGPNPVDPSGTTGLLALVGLAPLLVATEGRSLGKAYGLAFLAAWVHFVVVAHWLVVAFSHFGGLPTAAGTAAMLVVTAGVALFPATAIPAANLLEEKLGFSRWWTFGLTLSAAELLRDFMPFQGVPWGHPGVALGTVSIIAQSAAVVGVYGLVAFAGLTNGVLAHLVSGRIHAVSSPERSRRPLLVLGITLAIVLGYGGLRLMAPPVPDGAKTIKVALLQASIAQDTLNRGGAETAAEIRAAYHDLQDEAVAADADLVVWPEAALRPGARGDIDNLGRAGSMRTEVWQEGEEARVANSPRASIVGAVSTFGIPDLESGRILRGMYTSAFASGPGFDVVGRWDKVNLLPFGEYIPFPLRSFIKAFVKVGGNLVLGEQHRVVKMPIAGQDVVVGTTICYEGVFPGVTRKLAQDGADIMVNITNDAWYGTSGEMPQHLVHYRLRAIESGRAVARAANSGISAWIDSRGRVHSATARDQKVALVVDVPLLDETTPVKVLGDWFAVLALLLTVVAGFVALFGIPPSSEALGALKLPARVVAMATLPLTLVFLAVSAWAPVDEGIRTLCDAGSACMVFTALALGRSSVWMSRVSIATAAGLAALGIAAAVSISISLVGFTVLGLAVGAVVVLSRRS